MNWGAICFLSGNMLSLKSLAWCTSHCLVRYISILLQTSNFGCRQLRSASDRQCVIPRTQNTFGDRSCCVARQCMWSRLPGCPRSEDIRSNYFCLGTVRSWHFVANCCQTFVAVLHCMSVL